ncbi:PIG-L deacetylase family protein [Brevibacillus sp. 179-C9.3 HS]|uniref:PIG-L deacetylase family protein n=1 Tax=unclassified Brevibacillus TaxID=2684853 RepID=UPI0039A02D71
MKNKPILFVFAHPDDETFACGITISKYTDTQTASTHLLCATKGQAGKAGEPPLCTPEELPRFREQELRDACAILGLQSVDVWEYQDKFLNIVPVDELVNRIHQAIRQIKPEVVVTFAPHGISGHPDHLAISHATTQAVLSLDPDTSVRKLYYATTPTEGSLGALKPPFTDPMTSITTIINGPKYRDQVAAALRAHKTQHLSIDRVFPGVNDGVSTSVPPSDYYILAWHNLPNYTIQSKEADFFDGLHG